MSSCMENVCRVCLDPNVVLDWNNEIFEYCGTTYKDCYYQCTHLKNIDSLFSSMLCHNCSNVLENVHTLIVKALESHKAFQNKYHFQSDDDLNSTASSTKHSPAEFETILIERLKEEKPIRKEYLKNVSLVEEFEVKPTKSKSGKRANKRENLIKTSVDKYNKKDEKEECDSTTTVKLENSDCNEFFYTIETSEDEAPLSVLVAAKDYENKRKKCKLNDHSVVEQGQNEQNDNIREDKLLNDKTENDSSTQGDCKVKKKYEQKAGMCSICAKIIKNKYELQAHEDTHIENRERKETCPVCDLKFYDRVNLSTHMYIHKENRKKHKCEFCEKTFYHKGGLNVHMRIHLGKMIPCNLCSKQYYRQIDLVKHMSSHSATTINTDTIKRSKYFVRCEYCDKSIRSTSFKSHRAAHLNEPLMKCSICNKEYFLKSSCIHHIKTVHQKTKEDSYNFVIMYKTNRISHLFLKQKANIQVFDEK